MALDIENYDSIAIIPMFRSSEKIQIYILYFLGVSMSSPKLLELLYKF